MELFSTAWWSALMAIILIDLVLAGDNAIVIALAARQLPPHLQKRAIMWGTVGAIAVRSVMTLGVVWLLKIPGLMLVGGLGLVWIAYKLLADTGEDFAALLKKMGRGLLVTELMGQGINMVTGDYSRGAAGFWVENGEITHAVEEITIAGNLKDIFRGIIGAGTDVLSRGSKHCGSILIDRMTIAGE